MVADRVEAQPGRKAASLLLQQMRSSVGMLFGQSFKKLFDCMVQSVVLYGSEAWGCNASLSSLDHLQLRVFRSFLGVARSHPRVSLFMEMDCLPLCWEAKMRCVRFWHKMMTHPDYENRIIRRAAI